MAVMQLVVLAAIIFAAQASEFGLPERRSMLERGMATLKTHRSLYSGKEGPAASPSEGPSPAPSEGKFKATVKFSLTLPYTKASFDDAAQKKVVDAVSKALKLDAKDLKVGDVKDHASRHLLAGIDVSFIATVSGASSSAVSDLTDSIETALTGDLKALKAELKKAGVDVSGLKVTGVEVGRVEEVKEGSSPSESPSMSPDWAPGEGPAGDDYYIQVDSTLTLTGLTASDFSDSTTYDAFVKAAAKYVGVGVHDFHAPKKTITSKNLTNKVQIPIHTINYGATIDDVTAEANKIAANIDNHDAFKIALKGSGTGRKLQASILSTITNLDATKATLSAPGLLNTGSANTKAVAVAVAGVAAALALFL